MTIEKRQMGALGLIHREKSGIQQIYGFQDKGTIETASGLGNWIIPVSGHPWGIPGGGRHDAETALECVAREIQEELGVAIPSYSKGGMERLLYPFLVAQWKRLSEEEFASLRIDLFAVAGVSVAFDALSIESQNELENQVATNRGSWLELEQIARILHYPEFTARAVTLLQIRPQVATAAYLFYLQKFDELSRSIEEKIEIIKAMNRATHGFVATHQQGYLINNGTFGADGQLSTLSIDDHNFLFGNSNSSN